MSREDHRGFLAIEKSSGEFVGVINLGHIIYGRLRSAFVGYYGFGNAVGRGLMQEAMQLVLRHAFRKLRLHRLEANIQPGNRGSLKFARACGFVREGYSRRYLKVRGRWEDHERFAILASDWKDRSRPKAKTMAAERAEKAH